MAIYPCTVGSHRYPQAQQSIYFTTVLNDMLVTYLHRLCPTHFRDLAVKVQETMELVDETSVSGRDCEHCENPRVGAIFAKVFPAKQEMQQFAADLCAQCLDELSDMLRIRSGSPLAPR